MRLRELRIENLRNLESERLEFPSGFCVFTGANGAGKTSILEAAYLLSHGGSFRTRRGEVLVRRGAEACRVFAVAVGRDAVETRVGFEHAEGRWSARVNGQVAATLASALARCAAISFDPGAHALISGASEERRRFLDWGVFHVEPSHADASRRYRRTLNQRNAALRAGLADGQLDVWDEELARAAEPVCAARDRYTARFGPVLVNLLAEYLPELGEAEIRLSPGWSGEVGLGDALLASRASDRLRGHTTRGPHRADWSISFRHAPRREHFSRGQEKLCASACALAQARIYLADHGEWPVVLLDDLASELDEAHQDQVVASLREADQVLITGTEVPGTLGRTQTPFARFHVEQGRVQRLL
jgi:DNA replication and repair protein RecF